MTDRKYLIVNMGSPDRIVRIITGLIMIYFAYIDSSWIGNDAIAMIIGIIGIMSVVSGYLSYCPVYHMANVSTFRKPDNSSSDETSSGS